MSGQDERAAMLAFKRDMPEGIVEVGTAPNGRPIYKPIEAVEQPPRPLQAWDVYGPDDRKIERVYFDPAMSAQEVAKVVERNIRESRIGRLVRAGVERCQCGNPYTIRIDEALYCARCMPPSAQETASEPCLCGDKTAYQCSRACALSEDDSDPPAGECPTCQQAYALDAHAWTFCGDCWESHSHPTPHGGREAGNFWQYDESGHKRVQS